MAPQRNLKTGALPQKQEVGARPPFAGKKDSKNAFFEMMDSEGRGRKSTAFWQKQEELSKKKIIDYCRWLIKAKKIAARAQFGRLAPAYVVEFVRREQKWEAIGLPDYRIENQIKKRAERKEREMENASNRPVPGEKPAEGLFLDGRKDEDDPYSPLASLPQHTPFCPIRLTPPLPQPKFRLWKNAKESERMKMVSELFEAATKGELHNLMLLLRMGIPADARNKSGETALMQAAFYRHTSLCRILLEHGADPRAKNKHGENALSYAKDGERQEAIELIRDAIKKSR